MGDSLSHQSLEIGNEVTWGTAVATTKKLIAIEAPTLSPEVVREAVPQQRGTQVQNYDAPARRKSGMASIPGQVTYEHIPYLLDLLDAAAPGGAGPYTRDYAAPVVVGQAPSPDSYTLVYGDGDATMCLKGSTLKTLTISGARGEPVKFQAELIGKDSDDGESLTGVSDPTHTLVMHSDLALYIDAWGGTIGTTPVNSPGVSFELTIETNRALKYSLFSGDILPVNFLETFWSGTLNLSLNRDSATEALIAALVASGDFNRQIRIEATNGTNIFRLDFAGFAPSVPPSWADDEGSASYDFTFQHQYNPTLANWFMTHVTNDVAAMF